MSRIRSKNTKPELIVRKHLFSQGLRYRLHYKRLPGTPDIVLPKYRTVILVHGCFWHGHKDCRYAVIPKTRTEWWRAKIEKTRANDAANVMKIQLSGWNVVTVYECELKPDKKSNTLNRILKKIKNNGSSCS